MLTPARHKIILKTLQDQGVSKIQQLVDVTGASESTIRRDLSELEKSKKLKRVHGGASLLKQKSEEPSMIEKSSRHQQEKKWIAKYAASLIQDRDCIYLDAGTTIFEMIHFITATDIKVVTNGLTHIDDLIEKGIDVFITGGYVKHRTKAFIHRGALEGIKQYKFDKAFIGVNGIHAQFGYTTPDPEEAEMKKLAIELSQESFVLADSSKFQEVTFATIAPLQDAKIITDENDEDLLVPYKEKTEIEVVTT